jgi:hypothetical protein
MAQLPLTVRAHHRPMSRFTDEPIWVAEVGSTNSGGSKAAWITSMFSQLRSTPESPASCGSTSSTQAERGLADRNRSRRGEGMDPGFSAPDARSTPREGATR